MADTHKSIQSESESNASELSLSVDHRLLRMDTTYLIQILEMPKQKMQLKSMKSKSTREPYLTDSDDSDQDVETENTSLNRQNDISW
jgi:hypothetical protein